MRELKLIELYNLKTVWYGNPARYYGLENLQLIHIKSCPSLIRLFYYGATWKLHQLNELKLEACEQITGLVFSRYDEILPAKFPSLTKVEFKSLSRLKWFYSCGVELPSLKSLTIEKCPQLTSFTNGFAIANASPTIIDGKSFFELNELTLRSCDKLVVVVSSKTLQELGKLKKLIVSDCMELKMLFNIDGTISHSTELLKQLDELILNDLPNLTQIINEEIVELYQNLKILQVKNCESLEWLPISQVLKNMEIIDCTALHKIMIIHEEEGKRVPFFLNLVSLFIIHCHCLKSLFSLSQAQNLKKLKILRLCNCEKVEEVISSDKGEKVATIFPKMKCLVLKDLPKLVNFCQEGGCFNWPNLQTVRVNNIPSMKTFLRDDLNTPLLKSVYITFAKKLWLGNLNKTISYMHNNPGV
uniref:Disease resistance protein RPS2 n=1 Tax=Cajanus cajan TaxID=3821 RepID=A0A151QUT4_CAJCA|nr:Disease resistance protein RPS2 [Cajanus cajan]